MKFEQLLQIYWAKGFLCSGKLHSFNTNLFDFFSNLKGFSTKTNLLFMKRFEMGFFIIRKNKQLNELTLDERKIINMYLSQLISINNPINDLNRYNIIRLYLTKTFRGRAQALGKPSRGQRTWSNAWNAYNCNKIIRAFLINIKKNKKIEVVKKQINYKNLQKKIKKSYNKSKTRVVKKKKNLWF